uniref:Putative LOV domain-containing protein n=1 Tax=Heterochlamydomonas inaequalis TaxID=179866 RepID=A0A126WY88_9CHLO|nr:putative LOV domain-containing protein [Heterochlamydomonas inaequalis]
MALPPAVDEFLQQHLKAFDFAFTVSDPTKPDNPIVYASSRFYEVTGYGPEEVLGHNCRFLQGPGTSRQKVMEIRDALREQRSCQVCLLNFKKNGEPFWNQFYLSPILNEEGQLLHYVGIQTDVTDVVKAQQKAAPAAVPADDLQPLPGHSVSSFSAASNVPFEREESLEENPAIQRVAVLEEAESNEIQAVLRSEPCTQKSTHKLPCSLLQSLMGIQQSFVLSDPSLPDMPIVHASDKFLKISGYPREKVVGRNCRFLQGPDTDPNEVKRLRDALQHDPPLPVTVTLLNYKYDGTKFWNCLHVAPLRDADGKILFFIGIQLDVSQVDLIPEHLEIKEAVGTAASAPGPITLTHKLAHKGVTGAVRVAVRSLGGEQGLRRSLDYQGLPRTFTGSSSAASTCPISLQPSKCSIGSSDNTVST